MQKRVHIVHLFMTPAAVTSDLKQRLIDTWASILQNVIDEAVGQWRKQLDANMMQKDITLNSAKLKPALFRASTLHNWLFLQPPTVYRGIHVVTRYFHRSYLKANEVSKVKAQGKLNMHIIFATQCYA